MKIRFGPALLFALCLLLFATVSASAGRLYDLYVSPNGKDSLQAVHWTSSAGKHYLMLPSGCDLSTWKVGYDGDTFTVDGKSIKNGASASFLKPGKTLTLVTGKTSYKLTVMQGSDAVHTIWLETAIDYYTISKARSTTATMIVMDSSGKTEYKGKVSSIRVHGNSSRFFNKKSFALKLQEKTNLLGLGKNRDFVLLSLYRDSSKLRTSIAFDMARYAGLAYTLGYEMADVYFNGEYYGMFLLTGKVEVANDRVNIRNLEA